MQNPCRTTLSVSLVCLTALGALGCARTLSAAGRGVRVIRTAGDACEPVGEVSLPPGVAETEGARTTMALLRNEAGARAATHLVMPTEFRRELLAVGRAQAFRCDAVALQRVAVERHREQVLAARPELQGVATSGLHHRLGQEDASLAVSSTLVGVGGAGLITGLVVFFMNVGSPSLPRLSTLGGTTWSSGSPGNDEGMAAGGLIMGASAISLAIGIAWLVDVQSRRQPLRRLLQIHERLSVDADLGPSGGAVRIRGVF